MTATYSKDILSGSTDGKGILVTATAIGSGTTIHTAVSGTDDFDVVSLFAYNSDASAIELSIGWGGTTDPDNVIKQTLPAKSGLTLVIADLPIQNSAVIKAAAGTGSKVVIYGYANLVRGV